MRKWWTRKSFFTSEFPKSPASITLAVEEIWDSIAEHPEVVPVSQAQKDELDPRLQDITPTVKGSTWPQVKQRIQSKSRK